MGIRVRFVVAAVLIAGVATGIVLILMRGPVLITNGDCMPPPGYAAGGYRCYRAGHPHAGLGVLVILTAAGLIAMWLLRAWRSRVRAVSN